MTTINANIWITDQPIDPQAVTAQVLAPANGGVVTFLGTTRNETNKRPVLRLEYEAYSEMAIKVIASVLSELADHWGITDAAVVHRTGIVEIGQISMAVAVASPHRKEAFAACWYAVDRIKERAPIWKKEFFQDGCLWVGCGSENQIHGGLGENGLLV